MTAAAPPDRVTLKLGSFSRADGGSFRQRQASTLMIVTFVPAIALLILHVYLARLVLGAVTVLAVVLAVRVVRPGARVTAFADAEGIHWVSDRPTGIAWDRMDWVELSRTQPGGKLLATMGMNAGNYRTGDQFMITVVSGGMPCEVTPVRAAWAASRKAFGAGVAALARAHGVQVRVLTLGWGREDVNYEAPRMG